MSDIAVRALAERDWPEVQKIYREGIAAGNATFESEPPSWADFDQGKLQVGRLVATDPAGSVLGWVAASRVSAREVYRGVVEHSVYVADRAHGRGVGTALLTSFLRASDAADIWTVQASIFPENTASLALHGRAGFRRIGHRERIAYMTYGPWAGNWRDTILIERRRP
ncbi:GNAT family N-acetyltransferase [Microbacterium sp. SMR1]|jgi:phosphinothricin acetyltransferase|uniref:GNAT family N-acetyltransferase n=1 Tax=Microbacterium sp. SMR1 TaxID=1497340 RepID=UPI000DCC497F|nr:GNAT family N-acetyltransferase [Microbacterium sp. SMR1]MDF2917612.1 N-acetyltransferase [Microbacterium sp.]RAZ32706.1 N-acetyltransferase [Microbacterium sp. SMR1]